MPYPHLHWRSQVTLLIWWIQGTIPSSLLICSHLQILHLLLFQEPNCKRLLLEESEGVTHQKFHHHHLLPRRERNTLRLTLHNVFSPSIERVPNTPHMTMAVTPSSNTCWVSNPTKHFQTSNGLLGQISECCGRFSYKFLHINTVGLQAQILTKWLI